jgi:hypothetical protein
MYLREEFVMSANRIEQVYAAIDSANAADPQAVNVGGKLVPAALIYGERMTAMLEQFQRGWG